MGLWIVILTLTVCESALAFASYAKLDDALEDGSKRQKYAQYLNRAFASRTFCAVGRTIAIVCLFTLLLLPVQSGELGPVLFMGIGAVAMLMAELGGRFIGRKWTTAVLIALLPVLQLFWYLAHPFKKQADGTQQAKGLPIDEKVVDAAMEEIRVAIEDAATEGAIDNEEKEMIEGVLEFEDVELREIMTPRTEMECLEVNTPPRELLEKISQFHHTRLPVYEEIRDRVIGVLHVKDLVPAIADSGDSVPLRDLLRESFFVPETKRALSLLKDFKKRHLQIAVVLDEYGGVTGIVTLEDIMEQIVGELEEGFEAEKIEDRIRILGPGALDVDARLNVSEVNDLFGVYLPEDEGYDTIGGFLMTHFASVPKPGDELNYNGVSMKVLKGNDRQIHRVLLKKQSERDGSEKE